MTTCIRIARPVTALERLAAMYRQGLGLSELGRFQDHDGFDGIMLGRAGEAYHLEFTHCLRHPMVPAPTAEDLLVIYVPTVAEWERVCTDMLAAGFVEVPPFNPYWGVRGRTFQDPDGYRTVIEQDRWPPTDAA